MNSGIYVIVNTINNKKYIGKANNLKYRKSQHWSALQLGKHNNPHLQSSWKKYDETAFLFLILEQCDPEELIERETYWIEQLDTMDRTKGYNKISPDRYLVSEETRAKMSAAHKGKPSSMKGKQMSRETKTAISVAKRGKPLSELHKSRISTAHAGIRPSEETRAKLSEAHRNRLPHSAETKAKMSAAHKGRPWSKARREAQNNRTKE